jgi:branched-chain amino acid transport system ATP-binding protein
VGLRPDRITAQGMCRTFQNIRLFHNMTCARKHHGGRTHADAKHSLGRRAAYTQLQAIRGAARQEAQRLLLYVGLPRGLGDQLARNLPYGQQRRVEIARALASKPKLILLDEPTAGMNPQETESATRLFRKLRDELGVTVVLIEHDMKVVMGISERISVIDYGQKIAEGTPIGSAQGSARHRGVSGPARRKHGSFRCIEIRGELRGRLRPSAPSCEIAPNQEWRVGA